MLWTKGDQGCLKDSKGWEKGRRYGQKQQGTCSLYWQSILRHKLSPCLDRLKCTQSAILQAGASSYCTEELGGTYLGSGVFRGAHGKPSRLASRTSTTVFCSFSCPGRGAKLASPATTPPPLSRTQTQSPCRQLPPGRCSKTPTESDGVGRACSPAWKTMNAVFSAWVPYTSLLDPRRLQSGHQDIEDHAGAAPPRSMLTGLFWN